MIHLKLAWHSLNHHKQQYGLFLLASSLMVAINYVFWNLTFNHSIKASNYGTAIISVLGIGQVFVLLIAVFFMFYVNSFLMRQRDQELGLYNMLGMTRGDLRIILACENVLLLLGSIVIGLISGLTFVKLAFLFLGKLLNSKNLKEQFLLTPLVSVCLIFIAIFAVLLIYNFLRLRRIKPIMLWKQSTKAEKEPKTRFLMGIIGIILLAGGYYIALTTKANMAGISRFMLAVMLVVFGIYLVFTAGSIMLLKFLKNRRNFYYQPNHFISISGMLYRMKQNAVGLASICLLCTTILVTMTASVSLVVGQKNLIKQWNPFDIMLVTKKAVDNNMVLKYAKPNHVNIDKSSAIKVTSPSYGEIQKNELRIQSEMNNKTSKEISVLTVRSYNRLTKQKIKLKNNQLLVYVPGDKLTVKTLHVNKRVYDVKSITNFKLGANIDHTIFQPVYLVAANEEVVRNISQQPWIYINGINISGKTKNQKNFATQLQKKMKLDNGSFSFKAEINQLLSSFTGSLLFMGCLISLLMGMTTALVIYYKQVAEGVADRERFITMQEVGLSQRETKKAIWSQVLLVFMLPIVAAVINLCFAFPAIRSILQIFSMYNLKVLLQVSVLTVIILVAFYLLIFKLTTKVYQKIVTR